MIEDAVTGAVVVQMGVVGAGGRGQADPQIPLKQFALRKEESLSLAEDIS